MRGASLLNAAISLHVAVYRGSRGRIGQRVRGAPPILLLDHLGARSGRRRTAPLGYIRDGDDIVVVASKGGYPRHPAWYHNLMANPNTTIQIGRRRLRVRARAADGAERDRLWPRVVDAHQGYEGYQRRTQRTIPLVILEPRPDDGPAAASQRK
jgi:F420H(2)-dependent quinone reductase